MTATRTLRDLATGHPAAGRGRLPLGSNPRPQADDKDELARLAGVWVVTAENERGKANDSKDVEATHTIFTFAKCGRQVQADLRQRSRQARHGTPRAALHDRRREEVLGKST